jgi:hypothetical protein
MSAFRGLTITFPIARESFRPTFFHVFPRVHRLPNAVPLRDVAAQAAFARPHIHHVGIGDRNRDAANPRRSVVIEDGRPRVRAVRRFPNASAGGAKIVGRRVAGNSSRGNRPPASIRSDRAVLHPAKQRVALVLVILVVFRRWLVRSRGSLLCRIQLAIPLLLLGKSEYVRE